MSESEFYFSSKDETFGPYTQAQLIQLAEDGQITRASQVRKGATGSWYAAEKVRGLRPYVLNDAPPVNEPTSSVAAREKLEAPSSENKAAEAHSTQMEPASSKAWNSSRTRGIVAAAVAFFLTGGAVAYVSIHDSEALPGGFDSSAETTDGQDLIAKHERDSTQAGTTAIANPEGNKEQPNGVDFLKPVNPVDEIPDNVRCSSTLTEFDPEVPWTWTLESEVKALAANKKQVPQSKEARAVNSFMTAGSNLLRGLAKHSAEQDQATVLGMAGKVTNLLNVDKRQEAIRKELGYENPPAIWGVSRVDFDEFRKLLDRINGEPDHIVKLHERGGGIVQVDATVEYPARPSAPTFNAEKMKTPLAALGQFQQDMKQFDKMYQPGWLFDEFNDREGSFYLSLKKEENGYELFYRLNTMPFSISMEQVKGIEIDGNLVVGCSNSRREYAQVQNVYVKYIDRVVADRIDAFEQIDGLRSDAAEVLRDTFHNWLTMAVAGADRTVAPSVAQSSDQGKDVATSGGDTVRSSGRELNLKIRFSDGSNYSSSSFSYEFSGHSIKQGKTDGEGRASIPWPSGKQQITLYLQSSELLGGDRVHKVGIPSTGVLTFQMPKR